MRRPGFLRSMERWSRVRKPASLRVGRLPVSAFSTAWGVDQLNDGGKLVWAELAPLEAVAP